MSDILLAVILALSGLKLGIVLWYLAAQFKVGAYRAR